MLTYADDNKMGRQHAAQVIDECRATGDMPRLVGKIREAAAGDDSVSLGFLYEVGQRLADSKE